MKSRLCATLLCKNLSNPQNNPSKCRDCCSIFRKRAKYFKRLHNVPRVTQPEFEPSRVWLLWPHPLPVFTVLSCYGIGEDSLIDTNTAQAAPFLCGPCLSLYVDAPPVPTRRAFREYSLLIAQHTTFFYICPPNS